MDFGMCQRGEEALDKLIPISDYPKSGYLTGLPTRAERLAGTRSPGRADRSKRSLRGGICLIAFALSAGLLSSSILTCLPTYAAPSFISTYIDANSGCGSSTNALSFVLAGQGRQSPFGKPSAVWTDDDLATLKTALTECESAAAAKGNPYLLAEIKNDVSALLAKIPPIVRAARSDREARLRQLEARRAIAQSRIETANREKADAKASAATEVAQLEAEAARAEAEARQAIATANRRIDEASRVMGDRKAALADDLARFREISPFARGSGGCS